MDIGNFHVQHILKVYSQQLSIKSRVSKDKTNKNISQNDEVIISQESKKRMIVDKIANEIVTQLTNSSERNDTSREILSRLSKEYGAPLEVTTNDGSDIVFKVLNQSSGEVTQYLSSSETEQLKKKLFDITRSVVYDHLI